MLEDESGRICLVGDRIRLAGVVTGVILGALGIETHSGDFEVIDYCFAGMAPQETTWSTPKSSDDMEVDPRVLSVIMFSNELIIACSYRIIVIVAGRMDSTRLRPPSWRAFSRRRTNRASNRILDR